MGEEARSPIKVDTVRTRWVVFAYVALSAGEAIFSGPGGWFVLARSDWLIIAWLFWKWQATSLDIKDTVYGPASPRRQHFGEASAYAGILLLFSMGYGLLVVAALAQVAPELARAVMERFQDHRSILNSPDLATNLIRAFSVIILGPVLEEIVFRGVLLRRWARKFGALRGLILSSVLFGALHLFGFVGASVAGFLLGVLYLRSGSIWVPIAAHVAYNALATAIELIPGGRFYGMTPGVDPLLIWGVGGSALLLSISLLALVFVRNRPLFRSGTPGMKMTAIST